MNDQPIEEIAHDGLNYEEVVVGKQPETKKDFELFLSHCTKKETEQRKLVIAISEEIEKEQKLPTFLDRKDIHSNPVNIVSNSLEASRILVPICTPDYIEEFKKNNNSWVSVELGTFIVWQDNQSRDLIIPVLVDITRKEFETQGRGIAAITNKRSVEIPPEYITDKTIIKAKVNEIILIYQDYLKQWD